MSQVTLPGSPPVTVHLRRSGRARRLSLRVSQLDGRVTLTVPRGAPRSEAIAFAEAKAEWVRANLAQRPSDQPVDLGASIPVEGRARKIVPGEGRRLELTDGEIRIPEGSTGRRVRAFLTELARDRLARACDFYAGRLGRPYASLTLRDTRSRWGSCTETGRLMFSWRLVMAPGEVLNYVAAHEVAHLQEMNHGPEFWAAVERIHGPWKTQRNWLTENGATLHRYRF